MTAQELQETWRFWNVGGTWFGRRTTGEQVKAGTYIAVLNKVEWHEQIDA